MTALPPVLLPGFFHNKFRSIGSKGLLLIAIGILSGCSHLPRSKVETDPPPPKQLTDVLQEGLKETPDAQKSSIVINNEPIVVRGLRMDHVQFDIPITMNSKVEHWIDYFCGRGRPYFQKYLERSEFFIPYILPLLRQNRMPEDLVYLAMIESGFNNLARSRAKAVGPWQFMPETGKRYGLAVNWWVDERRDIRKSTLSAVEFLRDLFQIFQSWELAAAAYNAGPAKVARAVRRYGSKDFWTLARHRFFRPETREYVPKMIAAAIISKNRTQFGFPKAALAPGSDEAVAGDGEVVKLIKTDRPTSGDQEYQNDVESVLVDGEVADLEVDGSKTLSENSRHQPLARSIPTPHVSKEGEVGGAELAEFEVQSPADLLKVARAAGLSYQTVKSLNPEILRWCTPPTRETYHLKLPVSVKDHFLLTYNHEAFPRQVQFMTYHTKQGETLSKIAHHFGIKVDPVSDLNRISPRAALQRGLQILLPMPNDRSRTFASLEVRDPPEKRRHRNRTRRHSFRYQKITFKNRSAARAPRAFGTRLLQRVPGTRS